MSRPPAPLKSRRAAESRGRAAHLRCSNGFLRLLRPRKDLLRGRPLPALPARRSCSRSPPAAPSSWCSRPKCCFQNNLALQASRPGRRCPPPSRSTHARLCICAWRPRERRHPLRLAGLLSHLSQTDELSTSLLSPRMSLFSAPHPQPPRLVTLSLPPTAPAATAFLTLFPGGFP